MKENKRVREEGGGGGEPRKENVRNRRGEEKPGKNER